MKIPFFLIGFGTLGVLGRFYLDRLISTQWNSSFPIATFIINVFGSFLLGVFFVFGSEKASISPEFLTGLTVGLLGGFTTFSAYSLQTVLLLEQKNLQTAIFYFFLSPALGVLAAWLGLMATRYLTS